MNDANSFEKSESDKMKQIIQSGINQDILGNPYFSKKVMRAILLHSETHQSISLNSIHFNRYVKIVLFICLFLFPALTEAI